MSNRGMLKPEVAEGRIYKMRIYDLSGKFRSVLKFFSFVYFQVRSDTVRSGLLFKWKELLHADLRAAYDGICKIHTQIPGVVGWTHGCRTTAQHV